jgi:hypothetical protein
VLQTVDVFEPDLVPGGFNPVGLDGPDVEEERLTGREQEETVEDRSS